MSKKSDPVDIVWPSHLRILPTYAEVGSRYARSYTVVGYPRDVRPGWLEPLLGFPQPISMVFRSAPVDSGEAVRTMSRRMIWHRGSQDADRAQGRVGRAERAVALEDAEKVRLDLAKGEIRMIEVGLIITLWASDLETLENTSRLLESLAQSMLLTVRLLRYQQEIGLKRGLPLGEPSDKTREMDSRAWSTLFPFSSQDVVHPKGQVLGVNPISRNFIVADRFQLASPHSITIGWSGAGKSFAAKLEALRSRYRGWAISIVDPEGEYAMLQDVGATVWKLGGGNSSQAGFPYDPFILPMSQDIDEGARQADFLLRLLKRLSPELMTEYGGLVHDALWRILRGNRSRFIPDQSGQVDIAELLQELGVDSPRACQRLELAYQRWRSSVGTGSRRDHGQFEVYDCSHLSDAMKGPAYLALTEWLMRRMGSEAVRRLLIFDEAWHLLNDGESAAYLEELFRRARKWGTAISLLSQDIGDFTRNRAAEVCLRNAPMTLLLRQHPESLAEVAQLMRLHEGEVRIIETAGLGEGLLVLGDDHVPIRIVASRREQLLLANVGEGGRQS